MVYHSIFNSHILYGIQVWSQNSQIIRTKIQELQNRATIKITFSDSNCDMDELYKNLKLLKFPDLIYVQNCIFMSRVEQNLLPNMFKMQFTYLRDVHNHNTRASKRNQINIPNTNTHFFDLNDFLAKHVKTPEDVRSFG